MLEPFDPMIQVIEIKISLVTITRNVKTCAIQSVHNSTL